MVNQEPSEQEKWLEWAISCITERNKWWTLESGEMQNAAEALLDAYEREKTRREELEKELKYLREAIREVKI